MREGRKFDLEMEVNGNTYFRLNFGDNHFDNPEWLKNVLKMIENNLNEMAKMQRKEDK